MNKRFPLNRGGKLILFLEICNCLIDILVLQSCSYIFNAIGLCSALSPIYLDVGRKT